MSPSSSSPKPCSAALFGPQLTDLSADRLSRIREAIRASSARFRDLHAAIVHFEEFGSRLEASEPELGSIGARKGAAVLSQWLSDDDDAAVLGALEDRRHANAIEAALTVIHQVLLLVQHLNGDGAAATAEPQVSLHPETTFQGLCIGQLAATAARLSLCGERLAKLAATAMRLAFCIGAYVDLDQQRIAGDAGGGARCMVVSCRDELDDLQQIREILSGFNTAYISVIQKSKVTVTVGRAQEAALTEKLSANGSRVKPFNLFGRFHCAEMSWAVEKIIQLAKCQADLQLVSPRALGPILASILTLPQNWLSSLPQILANSELHTSPFALLVGENVASAKSLETLGFHVGTADALKAHIPGDEGRDDGLQQHAAHQINSEPAWAPPHSESAIAVIGVACKFAGADSVEELWKVLEAGTAMVRDLPEDRFPDSRFERRSFPKNFKGNTIDDVDAFDHKFFNVSTREAKYMDPQQRLALQTTYQALESAGYFTREAGDKTRDIGCYLAACTNEYHENVSTHPPSAYSLTGSIRPFISGKVSHFFGWTGPAITYDTACSASGTAIHQACRAVASGDCEEAIAGGTNVFVSPDTFQNLAGGHFISPTGGSKSFDASADGYCRGEGVAVVMLKKLSHALRDGDQIRGVIEATQLGQDANKVPITVPHGASQMMLYRKALQAANMDPLDISYVEAHGTGTPVGDPIEADSIRNVFGSPYRHDYERTYLGSLKANIGHTESSSGVSGLIKVLLMMQKGVIPQQALFNKLSPSIKPLEPDGMAIPTKSLPWTASFKAACVNNYGASGTNAVMVVTQRPNGRYSLERDSSANTTYPIAINAFSQSSLSAYCTALLEFIDQSASSPNDLTADIAYHLSRRRNPDLLYSVSGTISSVHELRNLCVSAQSQEIQKRAKTQPPVVFVFGGQTGKMASVPRAVYDSSTVFRKHLDNCDAALKALGAPSIFPAIFDRGPHEDTVLLHSILFSRQYATAMAWLDCGLQAARLIGHSFGQLTALCVSGVLSLHDGLRLITTRARYVRDNWGADSGAMIAIEADLDRVTSLLAQHADLALDIACYNGPQNYVVAGSTPSADAFETVLQSSSEKVRWKRLDVTNAFHSSLSEHLIAPLRETAEQLRFKSARIPLETCSRDSTWSTATPALVASHTREPVYFSHAVDRICEQLGPSSVWLEVGSESGNPVLRQALGKRASSHTLKSLSCAPDASPKQLADLTSDLWSLGLGGVQFWPFHHSQQHQYGVLNLPPYQFDKARHWMEWKELSPPAVVEVQAPPAPPAPAGLLSVVRKTEEGSTWNVNMECGEWKAMFSEEHRILGTPICPLSSQLEVIRKAIAMDTIGETSTQKTADSYIIKHLTVHRPVPAKPDNGLTLTINPVANEPQSWTFALLDSQDLMARYTSGTISVSASNEAQQDDYFSHFQSLLATSHVKGLMTDAEADSVRGKAVYKSLSPLFHFPKIGQRIREASTKGDEATAYLSSSFASSFKAVEDLLQVPLLCLNSLRDREEYEMFVNTAVGSAQFKSQCFDAASAGDESATCAAYLKFRKPQADAETITCDIFVFDVQTEQLFATILDVKFSRVQPDVLRQALGGGSDAAALPQMTATSSYFAPAPPAQSTQQRVDTSSAQHQPPQKQQPPPALTLENTTSQSPSLPDLTQTLYTLLAREADVDVSEIRGDILIPDLGIDSLMAIEVVEEINRGFSITLDSTDFLGVDDVSSLCRLIASRTTEFSYEGDASLRTPSDTTAGTSTSQPESSDTKMTSDEEGEDNTCPVSPKTISQAFDRIRPEFDTLAQEAGCADFWTEVYPSQARLIIAYITEAFAKLGVDLSTLPPGAQITPPPSPKRHPKLMRQLMRALRDDGLVDEPSEGVWLRTSKAVSKQPTSAEQFTSILEKFPQFSPDHKLLHNVGSQLAECLSGKLNPLPLLFGSAEKRKLMADQYTIAPIQASVSRQLGSFIEKCFSAQPITRPIRVLEIGGGTCGTTLHAVSAFAATGAPVEYTWTDISSSFIAEAKSKLKSYPFLTYTTCDITKPPPPSLLGHFDMILATNVIHATPDAAYSASNVRKMLRPGGFFTLMEYTRNLYMLDVVFGQLDGWWYFADGRDHAISSEGWWEGALKRAGFESVRWTEGGSGESRIFRIFLAE